MGPMHLELIFISIKSKLESLSRTSTFKAGIQKKYLRNTYLSCMHEVCQQELKLEIGDIGIYRKKWSCEFVRKIVMGL